MDFLFQAVWFGTSGGGVVVLELVCLFLFVFERARQKTYKIG